MPLHLQSIKDDDRQAERLTALLMMSGEDPDAIFVSEDKYLHTQYDLTNEISGEVFGKVVLTMKINEENIEILDLDIFLNNENRVALDFLDIREGSSDSNEYYDAATEDDIHLQVETVNRHTVDTELTGTRREVRACAFPFEATVYEDIRAFNRSVGFGDGINVGKTDLVVHGLSEKFMMPGTVMKEKQKKGESYTFLIGTVSSFQDVTWRLGNEDLDFALVWLDTALGCIPAAMGREVFDLSDLAVGKVVGMNADIKVDLSKPEVFHYVK